MQPVTLPTTTLDLEAPSSARSAFFALAGLALATLLSSLGTSIANVALPALSAAFSAPFSAIQWVVLAYLLASTVLVASVGRFGDLWGPRRLLLGGLALFTAAAALAGAAPTLWVLIAARALQGLGAAILLALSLALASVTFPPARLGRAMGLLGSMSAIGTALGPSLGGLLLATYGWRAIFAVQIPLGVVALGLVHHHLPSDRRLESPGGPAGRIPWDGLGTLTLTLTLGAYALAVTWGRGELGALNGALLLVAGAGAWLFWRVEARAALPLVDLAHFRQPGPRGGLTLSWIVAAVVMATLVVGPFYLAGALGLGPLQVGLAMTVGPLVAAASGIPAGRLVDRFGAPRMTTVGLAILTFGSATLAAVATRHVLAYLLPIAVITAGYGLFQAANNAAVLASTDRAQRGALAGLLNLARNLGLMTGAAILGALFAFATGTPALATAAPMALAKGLRLTFALATVPTALALALRLWAAHRRTSRIGK